MTTTRRQRGGGRRPDVGAHRGPRRRPSPAEVPVWARTHHQIPRPSASCWMSVSRKTQPAGDRRRTRTARCWGQRDAERGHRNGERLVQRPRRERPTSCSPGPVGAAAGRGRRPGERSSHLDAALQPFERVLDHAFGALGADEARDERPSSTASRYVTFVDSPRSSSRYSPRTSRTAPWASVETHEIAVSPAANA